MYFRKKFSFTLHRIFQLLRRDLHTCIQFSMANGYRAAPSVPVMKTNEFLINHLLMRLLPRRVQRERQIQIDQAAFSVEPHLALLAARKHIKREREIARANELREEVEEGKEASSKCFKHRDSVLNWWKESCTCADDPFSSFFFPLFSFFYSFRLPNRIIDVASCLTSRTFLINLTREWLVTCSFDSRFAAPYSFLLSDFSNRFHQYHRTYLRPFACFGNVFVRFSPDVSSSREN